MIQFLTNLNVVSVGMDSVLLLVLIVICFVFLVVLLEVRRQPLWKPAEIPWGIRFLIQQGLHGLWPLWPVPWGEVEKIQALRPMEILMTSQQNCFILRGTQLKTPSRVPLQIACICITHREHAREDWMFLFLVDVRALAFHMQQGGYVAVNCCRFHGWGQKEAVVITHKTSPVTTCCPYWTAFFGFFSKFEACVLIMTKLLAPIYDDCSRLVAAL